MIQRAEVADDRAPQGFLGRSESVAAVPCRRFFTEFKTLLPGAESFLAAVVLAPRFDDALEERAGDRTFRF